MGQELGALEQQQTAQVTSGDMFVGNSKHTSPGTSTPYLIQSNYSFK